MGDVSGDEERREDVSVDGEDVSHYVGECEGVSDIWELNRGSFSSVAVARLEHQKMLDMLIRGEAVLMTYPDPFPR